MALTADERLQVRRLLAERLVPVTWTKSQVGLAMNAVETWFESNRLNLGLSIEAAVPGVFTGPQKVAIVKAWIWIKAHKEQS